MTFSIQPAPQESYLIQGITVSKASIDAACQGLYMDYHYDPAFLMLSLEDRKEVGRQVNEGTNYRAEFPWDMTEQEYKRATAPLTKYINQTTGRLMDVYAPQWVPQGTVIFGRFEVGQQYEVPPVVGEMLRKETP